MGETFKRTIPHVTTLSDDQKADQRESGTLPRELCYDTMCDPTPVYAVDLLDTNQLWPVGIELSQVESGISHDDQSRLVMFTHGLIIPEGYIKTASLALSALGIPGLVVKHSGVKHSGR